PMAGHHRRSTLFPYTTLFRSACVVPVADDIKYQLPVAFVVAKPGTRPTEDALRRFALDNGPAYAHPRAVWFVDELPLAGTNKIEDRKSTRLNSSHQIISYAVF